MDAAAGRHDQPRGASARATINGAPYLGLDSELGSIEKGKLADLVVLDRNPLENIRNTESISMVMLNGRLYDGEDAERDRQPPARPGEVLVGTLATDRSSYRAYTPRPFTRDERADVTILFGGLHWRAERVLSAVFASQGYRAQALPTATKEDLLTGREVADIGQCCPTSFTTGNLANFLRKESVRIGSDEVSRKYVYFTAGSCGSCRFGQYHQSYEMALRNVGLEAFRLFLMAQDSLDQGAAKGDGLEINMPFTLGTVWTLLCTDLLQSIEYQVRPFEVVEGETAKAVDDSVDYLCDVFRRRPNRGRKWGPLLWHLTTPLLRQRAAGRASPFRRDRGRSPARQTDREDHRRVLPADRRRGAELQHPPLAGVGRRASLSGGHRGLARLLDALVRAGIRGSHRHRPLRARRRWPAVRTLQRLFALDLQSAAAGDGQYAAANFPISTSCGGWPRPTSTAVCPAAKATCWSARRCGRTFIRRRT